MNIRNFCIIAHIDHGKSTLADRFLELTKTVEKRKMRAQILDTMELEQERGITIKLQPVRMIYQSQIVGVQNFEPLQSKIQEFDYTLNLIDTPGHVDFTYEVSRSLAAVEGAILLVDATQGIQAQTLSNLYLALSQDLVIIPVVNKIDLPNAQTEEVAKEIEKLLGCKKSEILFISAKTGQGVEKVLQTIVEQVPEPKAKSQSQLRALIFDSFYDEYRGVGAYIRIVDGEIKKGDKIYFMATKAQAEVLDIGVMTPEQKSKNSLSAGEIGYVITGLKDLEKCKVGDTITLSGVARLASRQDARLNKNQRESLPKAEARYSLKSLAGYSEIKPMVFAGLYPKSADDYENLRTALEKLKLTDAAFSFEPEQAQALGKGFRCGFLGLLHLDIIVERLHREYNIESIITTPSVNYQVETRFSASRKNAPRDAINQTNAMNGVSTKNNIIMISNALDLPNPSQIKKISEPWVSLDIISPEKYLGGLMDLAISRRAEYVNTEHLEQKIILHFKIPLASLLTDFYDKLKSISSGYASMNYEFSKYRASNIVRLDILVAEEIKQELSLLVYKDNAYKIGRKIVQTLKQTMPKQMFPLKLQAALGGKIIATERLQALKKNVTAKLYGGDITRKQKLWKKQKKGKKKMMAMGKGKVEIPQEAYLAVLKK